APNRSRSPSARQARAGGGRSPRRPRRAGPRPATPGRRARGSIDDTARARCGTRSPRSPTPAAPAAGSARATPRRPRRRPGAGSAQARPAYPSWRRRRGLDLVGPDGFGADLLDRVPQLAPEDDLRVLGPAFQALVEHQLAVLVEPHQPELAQLLDEAPEQAAVEELRRRRRVQQAQPLRGQLAQTLELAGAQRAGSVLGQHRNGDVVALEGLLQRMAQGAQAEHLVRLAGVARQDAAVVIADLLEQSLAHEHVDGAVDAAGGALLVPGQEQLALQERVDRAADAQQGVARHAPVVLEAAGDPGRGGEQVQDVV